MTTDLISIEFRLNNEWTRNGYSDKITAKFGFNIILVQSKYNVKPYISRSFPKINHCNLIQNIGVAFIIS